MLLDLILNLLVVDYLSPFIGTLLSFVFIGSFISLIGILTLFILVDSLS